MFNLCINLDRRKDKLLYASAEFNRVGIGVFRVSAHDTNPGWKGCRDSHLKCLQLSRGEDIFGIYEDDVKFLYDKPYDKINEAILELTEDWDCLFLGASPQEPFIRYSPHTFKMGKAWTTHAIIWHNRKDGAVEYILNHAKEIQKIDVFFSDYIYPKFNCFLIYPLLCTQVQFQSDTCKRSDVSTIGKNYNKFCV